MKPFAAVIRVSHMGARKADADDFHSERDQIAACREAVSRVGQTVEILPSELDVSGGRPLEQRPSLHAAVEGVEAGRYAGIVVAYQSRLGRDVEQEEAVWRRVEAAGGQILLALDGIDATTVDGKMVRRIRSAINHAERDRHRQKFEELCKAATEAGVWQRRQTPKGYDKGPDRRLVPNADAPTVVRAFELRAAGGSLTAVATLLGMSPAGARKLLANRVYLGELRVRSHRNPAAHPPIVSVALFERAQISHPRVHRRTDGPALLAGVIRCDGCGNVMTRRNNGQLLYACKVHYGQGKRCAAPTGIACHLVDAVVDPIGERIVDGLRARSASLDLEALRAAAEDADAETAAYVVNVSARTPGYAEGLANRERDAAQAWQTYRDALEASQAGDCPERWADLTTAERNLVLRGAKISVVVRRTGKRVVPVAERVIVYDNHVNRAIWPAPAEN